MALEIPRDWTFETSGIAGAFDRHVREQLPWYDLVTGAIQHIARHYIPHGGLVYDIGASTGNIGLALDPIIKSRSARFIAIESSAEMCAAYRGPAELIHGDALQFEFEPFDFAALFLVASFFPVDKRADFFIRLRRSIKPGGAVAAFDKCEAQTGYPATVLWRLALAGKLAAKADPAEIVAKEMSLGGIQRPLRPSELGDGAVNWFRFGDFAGWLIEGDFV